MRPAFAAAALLSLLWLAPACRKAETTLSAPTDAGGVDSSLPPIPAGPKPRSQAELPTTDGSIAISNLDAQIAGVEAYLARDPKDFARRAMLVDLLGTRAQFRGRVADRERALTLADELVRDAPAKGDALLLRAGARAALHRFHDALADLDEAEKKGARGDGVRDTRASIFQGLGRYDEALALRRKASEERRTVTSLALEAALLGEMGRVDEAARLFEEAPKHFRDVSAFTIAWLYEQEGLLWERAGRRDRAKLFFAEAHARLPAFAHAAAHLAPHLPPADAIDVLRPIAAATDDPEYTAQLSEIERARGNTAEADRLRDEVKARYDALAAKWPEAYAEHAATFWLDVAGDPKKALALAKKNLEVRKTPRAYELVLLAATAANERRSVCAEAGEAAKLAYVAEMVRRVADAIVAECGPAAAASARPR